jgi:hypothetical protein
MMSFSFANCHIDCVRPDAIRAMYLVDGDAMIKIKLTTQLMTVQKRNSNKLIQNLSYSVQNGITGSNTFNKLEIETEQKDKASAF